MLYTQIPPEAARYAPRRAPKDRDALLKRWSAQDRARNKNRARAVLNDFLEVKPGEYIDTRLLEVTTGEISERIGVSIEEARRHLWALRSEGIVESVGCDVYRLTLKGLTGS